MHKLLEEGDFLRLDDMFSRGDVDVVSGARRSLVTGLMKAVSLGLTQEVKVGTAQCL